LSEFILGDVDQVDNTTGLQTLQVLGLDGEVFADVPRFQQSGFSSIPLTGSACILGFLQGRGHPVCWAVEGYNERPEGAVDGDVWLYHLLSGARIHLKADGTIDIAATNVNITGNLNAGGNVADANGTMQEMRDIYNSHNHGGVGPTPPMT
jgi:phage gp45-like